MMIPTRGAVAWLLREGSHQYWRAAIVRAEHDFGADAPSRRRGRRAV
jgi:hypothetical protein